MEKSPSQEKEKIEASAQSKKEKLVHIIGHFKKLSNEPGEFISAEEKEILSKQAKENPKAFEKWEKNRLSKYRINSLAAPLMAADFFLRDPKEVKNIPEKKLAEFLKRIDEAEEHLNEARKGWITDKEVNEVEKILDDLEPYL